MAEFVEIMKHADRICDHFSNCVNCPFFTHKENRCVLKNVSYDINWLEIENKVLEWVKTHPEPHYPTWKKWQDDLFPNAGQPFTACHFMSKCPYPELQECEKCHLQPIPESIAKILNISKIEEGE